MNFSHLGTIEADIAPQFPSTDISNVKIMLCGEAPGATEVTEGIPFVGAAGKLLDKALHEAAITRAECYITNVFWKRPPANKVDWFFAKKGDTTTSRFGPFRNRWLLTNWENQLDRLAFEVQSIKPTLVVAMGATALWAFTGLEKITMFRGVVRPISGGIKGFNEINMLATFHPSYILRNQNAYSELVDDLKTAKGYAG